ncbi:hypothetical protein PC114_g13302, partial [Phytophthora cactorum]
MRGLLRTLLLLAAGSLWSAPWVDGEAATTAEHVPMKRRLLESTVTKPSPRDPFMFDNHLVGDVSVRSHPVYGSASLSVRSGKIYRNIDSVGSPGAAVGAKSVPTGNDIRAYVNVGDVVLFGQVDARTVVGVNSAAISIDEGLQHRLQGGESIEVRKRVFATIEDTSLQTVVNSRGIQLYSHDDTVDVSSAHKVMQIRHFADASSATARLLPGNVSVKHGSDVVETLVDLSKELSGSMFVRLAGGSYLVDPVRLVTSTQFFIDRPFAGSSHDDLPILVDGIGAGILLEVRGTNVSAGASIDVIAAKVGEVVAADIVLSTTADGVSAGRVKINQTGIQFLGDTSTISSEVASISLQPAKDLTLVAGSVDNKPGSKVAIRSGASNWQRGGDINVETGQSMQGSTSGSLLLRTSNGIATNASSGSVNIGSGAGNVGPSGPITLSSGAAKYTESGHIHLSTGSADWACSGGITLETSSSTGGSGGSILVAVGAGDVGKGGIVHVSAGSTSDSESQGGAILMNAGSGPRLGGDIKLTAGSPQGNASSTNGIINGGEILLCGGISTNDDDGIGGPVLVQGGSGTKQGGHIQAIAGTGKSKDGGHVLLQSGKGSGASSVSGSLTLSSGEATAGKSGSVTLATAGATGGSSGSIDIAVGASDTGAAGLLKLQGGNNTADASVGGAVMV